MASMPRKKIRLLVSVWLLGIVALVLLLMGALGFRIYEVFADPHTSGHRWTIIAGEYNLFFCLAFVLIALALKLQDSYLRTKITEARINETSVPVTWGTVERVVTAEEEREGKIAQRYPQFISHMAKAYYEAPCTQDGVIVRVLVLARHDNLVLFAPLNAPSFFLGEIDQDHVMPCSQRFPKISQAIEAFLGRVADSSCIPTSR